MLSLNVSSMTDLTLTNSGLVCSSYIWALAQVIRFSVIFSVLDTDSLSWAPMVWISSFDMAPACFTNKLENPNNELSGLRRSWATTEKNLSLVWFRRSSSVFFWSMASRCAARALFIRFLLLLERKSRTSRMKNNVLTNTAAINVFRCCAIIWSCFTILSCALSKSDSSLVALITLAITEASFFLPCLVMLSSTMRNLSSVFCNLSYSPALK